MGMIFDIQRCSFHDGPGVRTTVFLKGCPLSCKWCHNPESQAAFSQIALFSDRCTLCGECERVCPVGVHSVTNEHNINAKKCISCGRCVDCCPNQALKLYGEDISAEEVFDLVQKDRAYYKKSGGGITVSGGEPTAQPNFLKQILTLCKNDGISTCIETCGFVKREVLDDILPFVDLFLFDYKATGDELHKELTGVSQKLILDNLEYLYSIGKDIILRCPIIFGYNDTDEHFSEIAKFEKTMPKLLGIEILPYHNLGVSKAKAIGMSTVELDNPDNAVKDNLRDRLCNAGCSEKVIGSF
jgi:pyruvate formate lyase activating enzyme